MYRDLRELLGTPLRGLALARTTVMDTIALLDVVDHASLLESVPVASLIADPSGAVLFANTRFNNLFGYAEGDVVGVQIEELIDAPIRGRSLGSDGAELVLGRKRDGSELLVEVGRGQWSTVMGPLLVYTLVDLTERIIAEQGRHEAERRLSDIVNNTTAVIYAKDIDGRYLMVNKQYFQRFNITQEQAAGKTDFDLFPHAMAEAFRRNDRAVTSSGKVLEIEEVAPHADGEHTYISVKFPLRDHKERIIGVAGISTDITDRIERLRVEQELRAAREIQRLLYPETPPIVPGFDLAGVVYPAHVMCGDYYDFIPLSDGRLLCLVADVTGHGIGPALEMVETRALIRAIVGFEANLEIVLQRLNQALVADLPSDNFVTMFVAEIDVERKQMRCCGAGHEGLLMRANGEALRIESTDTMLGILADNQFHLTDPIALAPGDVLVLATDGVAETMDEVNGFFGWEGFEQAVRDSRHRGAREIAATVYERARDFAHAPNQADDITILAAKVLE